MKIIYLHQYFKLPNQAGGTRSYEFARRLASWGHDVHIVTARSDETSPSIYEGINIHWIPVSYSNKMGFYRRISAFVRFAALATITASRIKADVIFATSTPLTIVFPGYVASRLQNIPMVFEVRDIWPEVPIALGILKNPLIIKLSKWLERFAYKNSERIVALAPGMARHIEESGIDKRRISVIPNGCDFDLFKLSAAKQQDFKSVLYLGTIGLANGVDYIPKLAQKIKQRHPNSDIRFLIAGDGKLKIEVEELARELEVEPMVRFLGAAPKSKIPDIISECVATIMTYTGPNILYRDSVSNKFFDSLAAGKPIYANFAGFSTLLAESVGAGVILDAVDLDNAADELVFSIKNDDFLIKAESAAKKLSKLFDRTILTKSLECVLKEAVERTPLRDSKMVGQHFFEIETKRK